MVELIEEVYQDSVEAGNWRDPIDEGFKLQRSIEWLEDAKKKLREGRMADIVSNDLYGSIDPTGVYETYVSGTTESCMAQSVINIMDAARGMGINLEYHIKEAVKYNKGL